MRALMLRSLGGFDAVSVAIVPDLSPGAGDVRVKLKAAALNHRELWIMQGEYPDVILPSTMGCDGAGVVDAVGAEVDPRMLGREVMLYPGLDWGDDPLFPARSFKLLGMPGPGTIAESITVPAQNAVAKPGYLSWEGAAAAPLAALTAWRGLFTKAKLKPGEKILITGAGGGVAIFAVQFAVAVGAEVYVTSSSEDTLHKAHHLGARGGFNYTVPDWRKALPRSAQGFQVVFDSAPVSGYPAYSRSTATGARIVIFGSTGGVTIPVSAPELFLKNLQVMGTNAGTLSEFQAMLAFIENHRIEPVIDRSFTLDHAKEALQHLQGGHAFGKVVITI
jgi:NADPH:quinone reductase-like Zn-dependent oxidoreductase